MKAIQSKLREVQKENDELVSKLNKKEHECEVKAEEKVSNTYVDHLCICGPPVYVEPLHIGEPPCVCGPTTYVDPLCMWTPCMCGPTAHVTPLGRYL